MDVGTAYLNAEMPADGFPKVIRLGRNLAAPLCQVDPSAAAFARADGTVVAHLTRALYGCVERAKLWYDELKARLLGDKFVVNPYKKCVFVKHAERGPDHRVIVAVYVDDFLVVAKHERQLHEAQATGVATSTLPWTTGAGADIADLDEGPDTLAPLPLVAPPSPAPDFDPPGLLQPTATALVDKGGPPPPEELGAGEQPQTPDPAEPAQ